MYGVCVVFCELGAPRGAPWGLPGATWRVNFSCCLHCSTVCLRGSKILGKCFLADPVKKSFHAANEACIAQGGTLGTPLGAEQNLELHRYAQQSIGPEEHIWLGVNDLVSEGHWVDQSGQSLRFNNWETAITLQPDGGRGQNCAILSSSANGKWFDENCRLEKASVCEFNIV